MRFIREGWLRAAKMHDQGYAIREIGKAMDVSASATSVRLDMGYKLRKYGVEDPPLWAVLSRQAYEGLLRAKLITPDDRWSKLTKIELSKKLLDTPGFGRNSLKEVAEAKGAWEIYKK